MHPNRFDKITQLFAARRSRRAAVRAGGLGLAAALAAPFAHDGSAQEAPPATPASDPNVPAPPADESTEAPVFLFVQPFDGGTWTPKAGEPDVYVLTLTGAAAQTVYFSDRPDRIVGLAPTQRFLENLGFTPANPPNAALVAQRSGSDEQEVLVVELLNPVYDAESGTLTYDAKVLADYGEHGLAHLALQQQDYELGEDFGAGSLFIDDCPNGTINCVKTVNGKEVNVGQRGGVKCCWHWNKVECVACEKDSDSDYYRQLCGERFPYDCFDNTTGTYICRARDKTCLG